MDILITQITPENIEEVGRQTTPFKVNAISGTFPLITLLWDVIASLFALAVYGFLLALIIGGFQYLVSQGKDDAIAKAKKTLTYSVIGLVIVFFGNLVVALFISQFGPSIVSGSVVTIIANIYSFILAISGVVLLFMLLFGGFRYMLAAGDDSVAESAKKQITAAIVGIILVALAFGIGRLILLLLQIPIRV